MQPHDAVRIRHILDAADTCAGFVAGKRRSDLDYDTMFRFAVIHAIEIIGEAASKLTDATRASLPEVPWQGAIGMRNRLAHAYFVIDVDIVMADSHD